MIYQCPPVPVLDTGPQKNRPYQSDVYGRFLCDPASSAGMGGFCDTGKSSFTCTN